MTIHFWVSRFIIAAGMVMAPMTSSKAAAFSVNPTADAFTTTGPSGNLSNNNYGGTGSISVAAPGLAQGEFQSVLQFDLAPAVSSFNSTFGVGQWSIQSVSLQLTAASGGNPIFNAPAAGTIGISWMQNDSWTEGTGTPNVPSATGITYSSLQGTFISPGDENLGAFSFAGGTSGNNTFSLGLSPGFDADVASGGTVSIRMFGADSSVSGVFSSRSFGTAANRPVLTIQAVPEPGTIGLLGFGFLVVGCRVSRSKKA